MGTFESPHESLLRICRCRGLTTRGPFCMTMTGVSYQPRNCINLTTDRRECGGCYLCHCERYTIDDMCSPFGTERMSAGPCIISHVEGWIYTAHPSIHADACMVSLRV